MAVSPLELACASCGAKLVVAAAERTARCPYCDSPAVVDRPATPDRPDPVFAIGFQVDRDRARELLRRHLRRRRWAPRAVREAATDRVDGVYLPAYLYTAVADSRFRAEIGEDYTVTEFDARRRRTRQVRRTEHRSLEGPHSCLVDDLLVTASGGIGNAELEAVEPFELGELRRFGPAVVSGWAAEEPTLTREASLEMARDEARRQVMGKLRAFMPGDSHRGLTASTLLTDEAMDLVLLPVWVCAVRWRSDRPPVRLLVNGQTGRVAGAVPVAWGRIAAVAGAGLALLALLALLARLL